MAETAVVETANAGTDSRALEFLLDPMDLADGIPLPDLGTGAGHRGDEGVEHPEMVAIHELSQTIALTVDVEEILQRVADAACRPFSADNVSILQPTPDGSDLCVVAVRGRGRQRLLGTRVPISQGVAGWVARNLKGVRIEGEASEALLGAVPARREIHSAVSLPMMVGGRFVGVLNVSNRRRRRFTPDQVHALAILSSTAAAALEHARLYGEAQQAEERYRAAAASLERVQKQTLENERMRALGQMASGIAHDFNNALVPVLGFSELLLTEPDAMEDPERVRRSLELIRIGATDAARVVARLREFYGRREEGEFFQPVNVNRIVEQVVLLTQPRWRDQALAGGITIRVVTDLGEDIPLVWGDEAELREAIVNLVFNAVDAMPAHGQLTLRTRSASNFVSIEAIDTGGGMTEYVREHCLEPLFSTKGDHGTGLGLTMVYGIVERHRGIVEIESEPDQGTTVRLRLPALKGGEEHEPLTDALALGTHVRILVVDHQPVTREVIESYLSSDGHWVNTAGSAREALERVQEGLYDVVLSARGLPEMSGDALARAIKESSPTTRVVLLTGFGDLMRAAGEQPEGVDAVVAKPVELADLRLTLARLVSSQVPTPPRRCARAVAASA